MNPDDMLAEWERLAEKIGPAEGRWAAERLGAAVRAGTEVLPAATAALRAVLDLHRRLPVHLLADECGHDEGEHEVEESSQGDEICLSSEPVEYCCDECSDLNGYEAVQYPCPTVQAVNDALGGQA